MKNKPRPIPLLIAASLVTSIPCMAERGPVAGFNSSTPYLIHYGNWTPTLVAEARTNYKMVILHPSTSNITPADIATIRSGPDLIAGNSDDVKVFAYISVGEDDRPGAPFAGDGAGPRMDPRPSYSGPLDDGLDPLGLSSSGGTGYASYYLDDQDFDGYPDQNSVFGGYYVNPGDPAWHAILKTKTKAIDGRAGIDELLTTTYGAGYGCDGLFLDTLDTPAPNSFGATYFEWTAKAYQNLVKNIGDDNPTKLLLANRGVFFYNPNLKPYAYTLRPYVNLLMYESYYTDSSGSGAASAYFDDNKFNYAPKINAEANRPDGFTVIALGYTTPGESAGLIEQDFIESQREQGWLLYRTNPSLDATPFNTQSAIWNAANPDTSPPVWNSTAATSADSDPGTSGNQPPAPRVGVQEAVPASGAAVIRWDIADDQTSPVKYNLYHTDAGVMDYGTATKISDITPSIPDNYLTATGAGRYPYQYTLGGLTNGTTYLVAIRAEDSLANEDTNTTVLSVTPQDASSVYRVVTIDGGFSDWDGIPVLASDPVDGTTVDFADVQVTNDSDYLYIRFTLHNAASPFSDFNTHLFLDADNNPSTGLSVAGAGIGSEMMIETGTAYDQRGGGFNEGSLDGVSWSISPAGPATAFELRISRSATFTTGGSPLFSGGSISLALQDNSGDTTAGIEFAFAPVPPEPSYFATISVDGDASDWAAIPAATTDSAGDGTPDIVSMKIANDADYLYLLVEYNGSVDVNTFNGSPSTFLSIDNDADAGTGFDIYGLGQLGAEVSWQNDFPFAQDAANYNLGSVFTNGAAVISPYNANTSFQEYRIARNGTYSTGGGPSQEIFPNAGIKLAMWTNDGVLAEFAGAVNYTFAAAPSVPSNFGHIEIDGDTSDWDSIPSVFTDITGEGTPDVASVKVANDDDYLYVLIEYAGPVDTNTLNGSPSNYLSIDNDSNTATGYDIFGLGQIGAEVSWQNDYPFAQDLTNFNLGATFTDGAAAISPYNSNTTFQEYRIARSATYNVGGPELPVFPNNLIRLALWSDDGVAAEFAGGFDYGFATNPGATAYEAWKLNLYTAPELLNPLVSGDSADGDLDGSSTLLEFALGGDPRVSDPEIKPTSAVTDFSGTDHLEFTYFRRNPVGELLYHPESSSNLSLWNDSPSQFTPVSTTPAGVGFEEVRLRLTVPAGTGPSFIRLKVILTP